MISRTNDCRTNICSTFVPEGRKRDYLLGVFALSHTVHSQCDYRSFANSWHDYLLGVSAPPAWPWSRPRPPPRPPEPPQGRIPGWPQRPWWPPRPPSCLRGVDSLIANQNLEHNRMVEDQQSPAHVPDGDSQPWYQCGTRHDPGFQRFSQLSSEDDGDDPEDPDNPDHQGALGQGILMMQAELVLSRTGSECSSRSPWSTRAICRSICIDGYHLADLCTVHTEIYEYILHEGQWASWGPHEWHGSGLPQICNHDRETVCQCNQSTSWTHDREMIAASTVPSSDKADWRIHGCVRNW